MTVPSAVKVAGDAPRLVVAIEPPVLAERLRMSMIHLSRRLRRHDPSELSIAQVSGLASVVNKGPLGIGRLAELESLPGSAATRLADKLEATGLVVRQATPGDRRGVQVVATPAGVEVLERYVRAGNEWLAARLASLSEVDRTSIARAITVLESMAAGEPGTAVEPHEGSRATEELAR
jgi:DNA-binding MarR family transcriptional regulator